MGKQDNKSTVQTAFLNTIANVLSLIVGAVMIPLITRVMSPSDIGISGTFLSNKNILVIVVTLAIYGYVNKAMLEFKNEKVDYIYSITFSCIVMVLISFIICIPFKESLKKLLSLDEFLFYWLFVSILINALYCIANYYCVFHNKSLLVFLIVLCTGPVSQILSLVLSKFLPQHKYIGRVLGLDATYFVVSAVLLIWLLLSGKHKFRKRYVLETLRFTIPIIPHMLSQMILTQCDMIMITYFAGSDKSGVYNMGHTIGFLAFTVMLQILAVWSPWVYRRLEENNIKSIYDNANYIVLIGMYISMGLITVSPELIKIFLTEEYEKCIYIILPLVVGMFMQFIYMFFYDLEYYNKKPHWIAINSSITAVINLILNFICISRFGYIAAAYTTLVSYIVLVILNYYSVRKLRVHDIYNVLFFFKALIFLTFYTIITFFMLDLIGVRYVVFVLITIFWVIKEYKNLILLVKSLKG